MMRSYVGGASHQRRGAVIVFTLITLIVLLGFAVLTLDVGALYNTRADLQNAADAGALAGAGMYASDDMMQVRLGKTEWIDRVLRSVDKQVRRVSYLNTSFGAKGTRVEHDDIVTGWIDTRSATEPINPDPAPLEYNAVQVTTRREKEGPNGPVEFFFASIFGHRTSNVSASAVAVYDDRFSAYDTSVPGAAPVWPFTIHEDEFDRWVESGGDSFEYDEDDGTVSTGRDGANEVRLYPDKLAPGNYGLLNIGIPNLGTPALREQITGGVPADAIELEVGTPELVWYTPDGDPITYDITGAVGLKSTLESEINARVGDIVAFFVHDQVIESGSGATYRTTGLRFARVMFVSLRGGTLWRGLWMQPVSYTGPGVVIEPGAPSSDGIAGMISLAR